MCLHADRFIETPAGHVIDLATGMAIRLTWHEVVPVGPSEDWEAACLAEWERGASDLIDFGWAGPVRFEARTVGAARRGVGGVCSRLARPLDALVEGLARGDADLPRRIAVLPRAGEDETDWHVLARALRIEGLVPLGTRLPMATSVDTLLAGRSVGLLCNDGSSWRHEAPHAPRLRWMARLALAGARLAAIVELAGEVEQAEGVRLRSRTSVAGTGRMAASMAADREGGEVTPAATGPSLTADVLAEARALLARGRRAAAVRRVEAALAADARRGQHRCAVDGRVALAHWAIARGELAPAARWLVAATPHVGEGAPTALVELVRLWGVIRLEQGRLDESERVLRIATEQARDVGVSVLETSVDLALCRGLFWRGRYAEAARLLRRVATRGGATADVVRHASLGARVALAEADVSTALAHVQRALDVAASLPGDAEGSVVRLVALGAALQVRAVLGDAPGVRATWIEARAVARGTTVVARVRVTLARLEAAVALGDDRAAREASAALERLRRMGRLPPLLGARVDLARSERRSRGGGAAARWLAARGVIVPKVRSSQGGGARVFDDVMELISWCQEADEERPVLERVCARVRERVSASVVSLVTDPVERGPLVVAGYARTPWGEPVRRAMITGATVGATRVNDATEAAVPVRWGGAPIAALACRWPLDLDVDDARVRPMLEGAAVACAPTVRTLIDRLAIDRGSDDDLGLVGASRALRLVREQVRRAALAPFPVLVEGESGSGKELVARAIHASGPRRGRRFAAVNCAAFSDDLLEAELFGHTRGAFTGASYDRVGLFEEADSGTLFLDEVSELSARAQAKLLRTLQEGEIRRLGENLARRVDVRVVAATNRALATETASGRFREDLRYRLDVIRIAVPPLRERADDIPLLAAHFWTAATSRLESRATLDPATVAALSGYHWPGNVRELQNVLAALAVHAPRRGRVGPRLLPPGIAGARAGGVRLSAARRALEADVIRAALARSHGCRSRAAGELGLSRQGLGKLMIRLGLEMPV